MNEKYEQLTQYVEKMKALETAMTLFGWDNETLAPKEAAPWTAQSVGVLSSMYQEVSTSEELRQLLEELDGASDLDEDQAAVVRILKRDTEELSKIPPEEYRAVSELQAQSTMIWAQAKRQNDYSLFAPYLEKIVSYTRKIAGYTRKEGMTLYDALLDDYEEGFTVEILDDFFAQLRTSIVPLLKRVEEKNDSIDTSPVEQSYDIEGQKKFCRYIAEYVGFDFNRGVMAESEHPFTTNLHNHDVRITNHYYENMPLSAIFSVIHESGHALYEFNVDDELTLTPAGGGASIGMHESQSRFMENIIGRSRAFWYPVYPKLVEIFPEQLKDVSLDDFVKIINKAQPGLIRTEADELTYSLHIMVRYEIEKALINGDLSVNDVPAVWNQKYEEYLGVRPASDAEGVLQDIHWSQGSIGYFPSYALGSAFAAQFYHTMQQDLDVEDCLMRGDMKPIQNWLKTRIHHSGAVRKSRDILREVTGEDFNPRYYTDYLTKKFEDIYGL